jgi:hypothetical protein
VTSMPLEQDTRSGRGPARRMHLDAPALATCLVATLAALGCIAMGVKHGYRFVVLLLDRGHIPARNAELFAACGWLAGALVLGLCCALIVRLMYRINGTASGTSDAAENQRGRHADGSGRRR